MSTLHLIRATWVLVIVFLLGGCAATGPHFAEHRPPKQEESRIYIYRPYRAVAQGSGPAIEFSEKKFGTLLNKGYTVVYAPPGEHRIAAKGNIFTWAFKDLELKITTVAGGTYYIRYIPEFLGVGSSQPGYVSVNFQHSLSIVENDVGRTEISECNLIEP